MKILVYTPERTIGEWIKKTLEEFGRGMHIIVKDERTDKLSSYNFSCIITLGDSGKNIPYNKLHINYPLPSTEEEKALLRQKLWALYRDTLRDMIGSKCSCGLYDICHCH